jgi:hypothetical protein
VHPDSGRKRMSYLKGLIIPPGVGRILSVRPCSECCFHRPSHRVQALLLSLFLLVHLVGFLYDSNCCGKVSHALVAISILYSSSCFRFLVICYPLKAPRLVAPGNVRKAAILVWCVAIFSATPALHIYVCIAFLASRGQELDTISL